MQQMEISDYINEQPSHGQKCSGDAKETERRRCQLIFLGFGMLCIIQAILNVALRVTLYSSKESTHSDYNVTHYNRLQERFNALTRDKDLLENQNTRLTSKIKTAKEQIERLEIKLTDVSGCGSQQCPVDWRMINSRCYFLSTENKTWEDSRKYCQSEDADLVVIHSEQEQKALYRLDENAELLFWIGLYDTAGTFKWVDGSVPIQEFWQPDQPDHGGSNNREDCVEMYHHNTVLCSWNDAPCGAKRRWLCEKDPSISC